MFIMKFSPCLYSSFSNLIYGILIKFLAITVLTSTREILPVLDAFKPCDGRIVPQGSVAHLVLK